MPLLGRAPLLGALFRSRSTDLEKTNLMVFIRPTILRDGERAGFQTGAKYRHLRDLQLERGRSGAMLMGDEARPLLPALGEVGARRTKRCPRAGHRPRINRPP